MNYIRKSFKNVDWKSYSIFLLITLLPIVYTLFIRPLFYEDGFNVNHLSMTHNAKWMLLLFVVVAETTFFPLISLFGRYISKKQYQEIENGMKLVLMIAIIMVIGINILGIFIFPLCSSINEVVNYMRFEAISWSMFVLVQIPLVFFQIKERKHLLEFLIIQIALFLIFDIFSHSHIYLLPLGTAISYFVFFIVELIILAKKYRINILSKRKINWNFLWEFYHLAHHSLVDAIIIDMILVLFIEGIGYNFGLADFNSFELAILLLPVTALVILVRSDLSLENNLDVIRSRTQNYAVVAGVLSLFWTLGILIIYLITGKQFWEFLSMHEIANFSFYIMALFIFFNIRAVSNVYKAAFYATGQLAYLTNIAVKLAVYVFLPAYILAVEQNIVYSIEQFVLISGIGIALESFLTIFSFYRMLRRQRIKQQG